MKLLLFIFGFYLPALYASGDHQKIVELKPNESQLQVDLERVFTETLQRTESYSATCYRDEPYETEVCETVTRYRTESQSSTCEREEAYTDYVCSNETRYRRKCRTQNENVCRNVPTSREVCRNVPTSREVCRNVPTTRRVCSNVPAKQVCRTINGRRVCSKVGGGTKCRDVSSTKRECRTETSSRRQCRTETSSKRVCSNVAREVCDNEPYTERVCDNVTKYRTETYSCTRQVEVPYYENECSMQTKYKEVPYSCTKTRQVPYTASYPHNAKIDIEIDGQSSEVHKLLLTLDENRKIVIAQDNATKKLVKLISQKDKRSQEGETTTIKSKIQLKLLDLDATPFDKILLTDPDYDKAEKKMSLKVNEELNLQIPLNAHIILINKKGEKVFNKEITLNKENLKEGQIHFNLKGKVKLNKKSSLKITLIKELDQSILNPNKEPLKKLFNFSKIGVK